MRRTKASREKAAAAQASRQSSQRIELAESAGGISLSPRKLHPTLQKQAVAHAQDTVSSLESQVAKQCRVFRGSGRSYYDAPVTVQVQRRSPSRSSSPTPEKTLSEADEVASLTHCEAAPPSVTAPFACRSWLDVLRLYTLGWISTMGSQGG
jgi:hypothetical protein